MSAHGLLALGDVVLGARVRAREAPGKSEAVLERIIRACTYHGDTVLDPYAGSGASGVVACRLGRRWIGIDNSPVAIRIARGRGLC